MTKNQNKLRCEEERKPDSTTDDLDLTLEVELDDEVKEIINSPRKCASALLDVTIIKPQEVEKLYTVQRKTLKGNDVKRIIASMNLDQKDMKRVVNHILAMEQEPMEIQFDTLKSSGDHEKVENAKRSMKPDAKVLTKLCSTDETNSDDAAKRNGRVKQIYTTPKTFHELNAIFECKNKRTTELNDKAGGPCTCENCAIVGLVTDSQKRPFVTEPLLDPREISIQGRKDFKHDCKKRKVNFKEEDHSQCQHYFKFLCNKIKELEERIAAQEDRAVPKEYFRKIITKLVTHITKFTTTVSQTKMPPSSKRRDRKTETIFHETSYENFKHKYNIHPVMVEEKSTKTSPERELSPPRKSAEPYTSTGYAQPFWKWGEEILKPGIDIKNKIIVLLEDTLRNLKWSKGNSARETDINSIVDEISNNLYKTVRDIPERYGNSHNKRKKEHTYDDSSVTISYVNPASWEESQISFRCEVSEQECTKKPENEKSKDIYSKEFLKIIQNTKEADKLKLWRSIWKQAMANGQTKNDKATIQLPDKRSGKNHKIVEIEYSIGELEALLVGRKA